MMSLVLLLPNTLAAVYYAKKRWYMASIAFVLSSAVLFLMSIFLVRVPVATDGMIGLIGIDNYLLIQDLLLTYTPLAMSPYLAILAIFVIATIVITIETAATLIDNIKRKKPQRVARNPRVVRLTRQSYFLNKQKIYLSFCTMLC